MLISAFLPKKDRAIEIGCDISRASIIKFDVVQHLSFEVNGEVEGANHAKHEWFPLSFRLFIGFPAARKTQARRPQGWMEQFFRRNDAGWVGEREYATGKDVRYA